MNLEKNRRNNIPAKNMGLRAVDGTPAWYYLSDDATWHLARTWTTEQGDAAGVPAAVPECRFERMLGDMDWHGPEALPARSFGTAVCGECWKIFSGGGDAGC